MANTIGNNPKKRRAGGGTRFTNLNTYLGANRGAGGVMGGQISRDAGNKAQGIGQAVKARGEAAIGAQEDIASAIDKGRAGGVKAFKDAGSMPAVDQANQEKDANTEAANTAAATAANTANNMAVTDQANEAQVNQTNAETEAAKAEAERLKQQQASMDSFNNLYGGMLTEQAKGMNTNIDELNKRSQNLQGMADATQSEKGRFGLLRNTFGMPGSQYGMGQGTLDQLFLQADPSAQANLNKMAGMAQEQQAGVTGLGENLVSGQEEALAAAQQGKADLSELFKTGMYGDEDLGEGYEDISGALTESAATETARRREEEAKMKSSLDAIINNKDISPEDKAALYTQLGISEDQALFGADLKQYQNEPGGDIGAGEMASQEQKDRYNALMGLSGQESGLDFSGDTYQAQDIFNKEGLSKSIAENEAAFRESSQNAISDINKYSNARDIVASHGHSYGSGQKEVGFAIQSALNKSGIDIMNDPESKAIYDSYMNKIADDRSQSGSYKTDLSVAAIDAIIANKKDKLTKFSREAGALTGVGNIDTGQSVEDILSRYGSVEAPNATEDNPYGIGTTAKGYGS